MLRLALINHILFTNSGLIQSDDNAGGIIELDLENQELVNIFNSDNIIAKVGNTPISTTRFNRALRLNIQQFNEMLGKNLSGEEIKDFQIHQLALGAIVNETIFENEFDKLNFKLDKTIIAKKSNEALPQLYNSNNELDENYLQQFLSNQGLKIEDIVQIFHYDARNEYFNSIILNIKFPNSFTKKIDNQNYETLALKPFYSQHYLFI